MKLVIKYFVLSILAGGLLFARSGEGNSRVSQKKVKNDYYVAKDDSFNKEDNKLDRKRVHKRRRKIRKPIKGLR